MREIESFRGKARTGREVRIFNEWKKLDDCYANNSEISFIIRKRNPNGIPLAYDVIYAIPSITGVEPPDEKGLQKPVFGNRHVLRITLPNNYPSVEGGHPDFKFTTGIWHPNIRYFGDDFIKGKVCLNFEDSGVETSLVDYIERIADYLRYVDYHAKNEYPYPEDQNVAEWVLEQAEPQGWLNFSKSGDE